MMLSVIVPTRNRADYLDSALSSVFSQTLSEENYEVIVIDNGSTDTTREMTSKYMGQHSNIQYHYVAEPGLHIGRHLGAKHANGEVLVFCDDDIIACHDWLKAIYETFRDESVALAGGKVLPKWEGEIPFWIEQFKTTVNEGWSLGYLSLLDFGNETFDVEPYYVYGCNFSIRKDVLYSCGGFHPDAMPQELIRYRGDGETGLSKKIAEKGLRSVYVPNAMVYHRVSQDRLTIDYFCRRAFNQGVSDSYSEIRSACGLKQTISWKQRIDRLCNTLVIKCVPITLLVKGVCSSAAKESYAASVEVKQAYRSGYTYHRNEVRSDAELLRHVLRENYY